MNTSGLTVGDAGVGTLSISGGAVVVHNGSAVLGNEAGSLGSVSRSDAGSIGETGSDLTVGNLGGGTLNVEAGGTVSVTNPAGLVQWEFPWGQRALFT